MSKVLIVGLLRRCIDPFFSLSYGVISRMVLIIISAMAVRNLDVVSYGQFGYFLSIVSSAATLSVFGFGATSNAYVAKYVKSDKEFARNVLHCCLVFVSVLAVLVSILTYFAGAAASAEGVAFGRAASLIILICIVWSIGVGSVIEGALYGLGMYRRLSINSIFAFLISVPSGWVAIKKYGLMGALISLLIYRVVLLLLNIFPAYFSGILRFRFDREILCQRRILDVFTSFSLPIAISGALVGPLIALAMGRISSHIDGSAQIAYFSWPYQIYGAAVFVPATLAPFFLSRLSSGSMAGRRTFKILLFNTFFSILVAIGLMLAKKPLLNMAGPEYLIGGGSVYDLLVLGALMYGLNAAFSSHWPAIGRNWLGLVMNVVWGATLLATVWLFADEYGARALAAGFVTAYSVLFILQIAVFLMLQRVKENVFG